VDLGLGKLLIRADGNVAMGTGHVMRCLALAQAWQDCGGHSTFAMAQSTPSLERRLQDEGMEVECLPASGGTVEDVKQTIHFARRLNPDWIVLDGYQFGADYQAAIHDAGFKLLFMDDQGQAAPYCADLVLNQNFHANRSLYAQRDASTQLLLGPRYALLRREFRHWRKWNREIPSVARKALVTMGGSDPDNLTVRVLEAIQKLSNPELETVVLVGGSNPHVGSMEKIISEQRLAVRLMVDAVNIGEWMAWADVAIAGAGTTFWEMCFLGLPGILLVLAENQEGIAEAAGRLQIACNLGKQADLSADRIAEELDRLLKSEEERTKQSINGRRIVDGRGAERVVAFLSGLKLRRAEESDCELFWKWANDPQARAASFRSDTISWEEHAKWFRTKLADPQAVLYTVTDRNNLPLGEVRYQIQGERAVISISLDANFRGRGWGQKILAVAMEKVFQEFDINFIDAYVKPSNESSMKVFESAGFLRFPSTVIEGQDAIHFVLARSGIE
jgi:UDP-2,4-diacetamido-2,4,6-trideoxy-beta-L-altropyranose hydrolase